MVEKVGYTRPVNAARGVKKASSTSGAGFAEALSAAESALGVEGTQSVAAVSGVGALLGAQEVSEQEVRRRRSIKRAGLTIGALEQLRDALLIGSMPMTTLPVSEAIIAEERSHTDDPLLQQILDEIELRAAVELAKLEMAGLQRF